MVFMLDKYHKEQIKMINHIIIARGLNKHINVTFRSLDRGC